MNKNSSIYTFLYTIIMVVVVAVVLAVTYSFLKPYQLRNIEIDKKYQILASIHRATQVDSASDRNSYIENEYRQYIKRAFAVNINGEVVPGVDGFNVDLIKEFRKESLSEMVFPIFECVLDNAETKYVFSLTGRGLWGPIWGYLALNSDMNTVYGIVFDHKGETPGLGAEITQPQFCQSFYGKKIFDKDKFTSIKVVKAGSVALDEHKVDGISGGTITSKGVEKMLYDVLLAYEQYIKKNISEQQTLENEITPAEQSPTVPATKITPAKPLVPEKPLQPQTKMTESHSSNHTSKTHLDSVTLSKKTVPTENHQQDTLSLEKTEES